MDSSTFVEGDQTVRPVDHYGLGRRDIIDVARTDVRIVWRQAHCFELGSGQLDDVCGVADFFRNWGWGVARWQRKRATHLALVADLTDFVTCDRLEQDRCDDLHVDLCVALRVFDLDLRGVVPWCMAIVAFHISGGWVQQ